MTSDTTLSSQVMYINALGERELKKYLHQNNYNIKGD
jgi:DNA-dependent RNA polymerase auxiliary subunit epsilon